MIFGNNIYRGVLLHYTYRIPPPVAVPWTPLGDFRPWPRSLASAITSRTTAFWIKGCTMRTVRVQLSAQYITQLFVWYVSAGLCQPQPPMPTVSRTR